MGRLSIFLDEDLMKLDGRMEDLLLEIKTPLPPYGRILMQEGGMQEDLELMSD